MQKEDHMELNFEDREKQKWIKQGKKTGLFV